MIMCLSPWKSLAYFAPVLVVLWFIWIARSGLARRKAKRWLLGWLVVIGLYWVLRSKFDVTPAILAILTYGTFGALYVIPNNGLGSTRLLGRVFRLVAFVVVVEAALGIAQAGASALQTGTFDLSNGDAVQGTIDPRFHASLSLGS